ncbi:MAG: M23 family metallopeptidase, partial [Verrucomicrobiota bacterium]
MIRSLLAGTALMGLVLSAEAQQKYALGLTLPTDNTAIFTDDPSNFYMYTNRNFEGVSSKPWSGGTYGFSRNQKRTSALGVIFTRLHEGVDINPVRRDSNGVPLDDVRAIAAGRVVYVNPSATASSYGKYVVIEHDWGNGVFCTLYAHLASASAKVGDVVSPGTPIAKLGYTGRGLDRERAHLHLEFNFLLSERFQTWYSKHFSSANVHGNYNGFNLTGMDVSRLLLEHNKNPRITIREFLDKEEPYFKVRVPGSPMKRLDFLARYPMLGKNMGPAGSAQGWEFTFARTGVPLSIEPLSTAVKGAYVSWVKNVPTNHSYMTMGRLEGSGSKAQLSA